MLNTLTEYISIQCTKSGFQNKLYTTINDNNIIEMPHYIAIIVHLVKYTHICQKKDR